MQSEASYFGHSASKPAAKPASNGLNHNGVVKRVARKRTHHRQPAGQRKLAALLKGRRKALGMTQNSLAKKLTVKPSHVALLESGRRRPSLALLVRLSVTLGVDGQEVLLLAYPEAKKLIAPPGGQSRKLSPSWQRLFNNSALLARYRVTRRELDALRHLGALGGRLTVKRLAAILMLVRDIA
jgi:transcriptional regulator with XRE-family HTH domain